MRESSEEVSRNLRDTFETLARHSPAGATEQFGSVRAVSAGVPTPTFNRAFVFEPFEKADLMAAIDWFTDRDDPFWVTGLETLRKDIEAAFGDDSYEKSDPPQPGMARDLTTDLPATDTDIDINVASGETELDAWMEVAESVFEFSGETNRLITPPSVLGDQDLQYFVGRVDGQPAACGMLNVDGTVAGVYVIGVDEAFRRRGIGEAMTWEVLREGQAKGAEMGVLQSTQMGYPLYDQMGFETEVEFRHFAKESW
jgi:ribosomal protein S18 acetylase RimI-like enzyme